MTKRQTKKPPKKTDADKRSKSTPTSRKPRGQTKKPRTVAAKPAASRPPSGPDRVFEFADQLQKKRAEGSEEEKQELETWATCKLERETFALRVQQVREILRVTHIARVPDAPHPVLGVTNLRGQVLAVVDLRLRLGLDPIEPGPQHRIVVVSSRGRTIGLLVDSVDQIIDIDKHAIEPPPADVMTDRSQYILGVYQLQDDLLILLDADRVLQIHEVRGKR